MSRRAPARLAVEQIHARRLVLVPLDAAAADSLLVGRGDLRCAAGWPDAETAARLQLAAAAGDSPYWLVVCGGEVVGDCTAHGGPDDDGGVEIGYALAARYRGRGLGRELVAALTAWLLAQDDVRRVVASTSPDNVPSRRSLERAGFRLDRADAGSVRYLRTSER